MQTSSLFANGLTAKNTINFNGNNVSVDAYDSTLGVWNYTLNREDEGSVASISVDNGALDVGNGDIWGYMATGGGSYDIGPNGSVKGEDKPSGVDEDPLRISFDFKADLPDATAPSLTPDHTSLSAGDVGDPSASWSSDPEVYILSSSFSLSGKNDINVVGPTVIIVGGNFSFSGKAELNILGPDSYLELYVSGDVSLTGQGAFNDEENPEALQLLGNSPIRNEPNDKSRWKW